MKKKTKKSKSVKPGKAIAKRTTAKKVKAKKATAGKTTKSAPKKQSKGLSIMELFKMKQEKLMKNGMEVPGGDPTKVHTKELHPKSELKDKKDVGKRVSGFGGSRHH